MQSNLNDVIDMFSEFFTPLYTVTTNETSTVFYQQHFSILCDSRTLREDVFLNFQQEFDLKLAWHVPFPSNYQSSTGILLILRSIV